ncbi:uncharacterized protein [Coffea arabica]|uniref:ATP-dependent DNA helicase n=1 Tax=Coffea arabica TaxID=13443 RepID=A0ABM4VH13_COFAR
MSKRAAIEALDDLLQDLMSSDDIFGGKVVVLGGDFRQTLPVVCNGSKSQTVNACLINSYLWPHLEKLQLTDNMRARLDPSFTQFLLKVGDGLEKSEIQDCIQIPPSILIKYDNETDSLQPLIGVVYPDLNQLSQNADSSLNRAILSTKNHFVDEINDLMIEKFPGNSVEYISFDETINPNYQAEYVDLLNTLAPSGLPPHKLTLKPNSPIILLRNLDPTEGLCNGTRLICKTLQKNVVHAQIAVGEFAGKEVFIHRIPLQPSNDE